VRNIRALTAVPPYQSFAHAVPRRGGHLFPQPVKAVNPLITQQDILFRYSISTDEMIVYRLTN
jgi:hypothetical protein